jgi:hypothetical protein
VELEVFCKKKKGASRSGFGESEASESLPNMCLVYIIKEQS